MDLHGASCFCNQPSGHRGDMPTAQAGQRLSCWIGWYTQTRFSSGHVNRGDDTLQTTEKAGDGENWKNSEKNWAEPSRIIRSRVLSPHCADHASRGAVTAGALDPTGWRVAQIESRAARGNVCSRAARNFFFRFFRHVIFSTMDSGDIYSSGGCSVCCCRRSRS